MTNSNENNNEQQPEHPDTDRAVWDEVRLAFTDAGNTLQQAAGDSAILVAETTALSAEVLRSTVVVTTGVVKVTRSYIAVTDVDTVTSSLVDMLSVGGDTKK